MAKGRTNQPLLIWVAPQYRESPPVQALQAQGHRVLSMIPGVLAEAEGLEPDLILHPAAHQWNDMMWDFLPAAIAAARKRKRDQRSAG